MTDDNRHAGVDRLLCRRHRLNGVAGVIDGDDPHVAAEDPASAVEVLDCRLHGDAVAAAGRRVGAGERVGEADRDLGRALSR